MLYIISSFKQLNYKLLNGQEIPELQLKPQLKQNHQHHEKDKMTNKQKSPK